ncbi:MAG: hypothetical protein HN774_09030 [Bacteroidetes Order II. Incertae sedis bacterium]|nr:hypothetical protein [Bacteroidetes Order II. bacterium]
MLTKLPVLEGPLIGDRVRSFDFQHMRDIEGDRACYMIGQITGLKQVEGCWRYKIEVQQCIQGGQEQANFPAVIYPPVNGTNRMFGGVCDGVESI